MDARINGWDISSQGVPSQNLVGHSKGIRSLHVEGKVMCSGAGDSVARLWNTETAVDTNAHVILLPAI